jgi:hypothetical protein
MAQKVKEGNHQTSSGNDSGFHKREITCYKCQKKGHIAQNCPTKKKNEVQNEVAQVSREYDVALVRIESETVLTSHGSNNIPDNLWIADSGASCHVAYNDIGMFDTAYSNSHIIVGGGTKLPIVKKGKL